MKPLNSIYNKEFRRLVEKDRLEASRVANKLITSAVTSTQILVAVKWYLSSDQTESDKDHLIHSIEKLYLQERSSNGGI